VTAPGGDVGQVPDTPSRNPGVLTTVNRGAWIYFGGTSAAAPHVVGVVALRRRPQCAKSQRVAPPGSAPATPIAVCSVRR
jgi:subtilase family protein